MNRVEEIKARLNTATPGPWQCRTQLFDGDRYWYLTTHDPKIGDLLEESENRRFVESAPSDLAWAVERIEEMAEALRFYDDLETWAYDNGWRFVARIGEADYPGQRAARALANLGDTNAAK